MKKLSKITAGLTGQPMFQLLTKANDMEAKGRRILHFEIGDSGFESFFHIRETTKKALDMDHTHYVDSAGIPELRTAVADHIEDSLQYRPDSEQIVIMPANSVIDFVIRCVADEGEEIIFPDPGFSTYRAVSNYTGVKAITVQLKEENNFHIEPKKIAEKITDKTRLLIINSPHNPTGAVLDMDEIKSIYKIAEDNDIYLLSDEVYSRVIYDKIHYSPSVFDKCKSRTIILNGFSKSYSMPGWRLGYAIGPEELIKKMTLLFQTIYSCTPPFIQHAGVSALKDNQHIVENRILKFKELRDLLIEEVNQISGLSCTVPDGAYYVFVNIKDTGMNSSEFADFALEKAGVAVLPGTCLGNYGEGFVRICFARKPTVIKEACSKLKIALADLNPKSQIQDVNIPATKHNKVSETVS